MHREKDPLFDGSRYYDWILDDDDKVFSYCLKCDKGIWRIAEYQITKGSREYKNNIVSLRKHYPGGKSSEVFMNRIIVVNVDKPREYALKMLYVTVLNKAKEEESQGLLTERRKTQLEFLENELEKELKET